MFVHTHLQTCTYAHMHTCVHSHIHTYTHARAHTHTHNHIHTRTHTQSHTHTCTRTHTHTHTHTHAHTITYTHVLHPQQQIYLMCHLIMSVVCCIPTIANEWVCFRGMGWYDGVDNVRLLLGIFEMLCGIVLTRDFYRKNLSYIVTSPSLLRLI